MYMTPRESLVSDIPAGDGNIEKFFYGVMKKEWSNRSTKTYLILAFFTFGMKR
jgi:hypothetical protein